MVMPIGYTVNDIILIMLIKERNKRNFVRNKVKIAKKILEFKVEPIIL